MGKYITSKNHWLEKQVPNLVIMNKSFELKNETQFVILPHLIHMTVAIMQNERNI